MQILLLLLSHFVPPPCIPGIIGRHHRTNNRCHHHHHHHNNSSHHPPVTMFPQGRPVIPWEEDHPCQHHHSHKDTTIHRSSPVLRPGHTNSSRAPSATHLHTPTGMVLAPLRTAVAVLYHPHPDHPQGTTTKLLDHHQLAL